MGFGIETSSHKYGLFQHICKSFEIILPTGELIKCSKEENSELFKAIPWSYGTIGYLVSAEIEIIEAKKYVKVEYKSYNTCKEYQEAFIKESNNEENDFVEGLIYTKDKG
jgi:FAD/FMN-containing dehydrogenase